MTLRKLEVAAVLAAGLGFLVLPKPPAAVAPLAGFIVVTMAAAGAWLVWRVRREPALIARWGLDPTVGRGPLLRVLLPLGAVAVVGSAAVAVAAGRSLLVPYLWLSLLVYPVWGLVQQWLVQALVVDNLRVLTGLSRGAACVLGGVGFGLLHVEHPLLVLATAGLGAVYVLLFQRWRNLWPLGVAHGWLGSVFYPWVLGRNPLAELIELL